jgi:hypothetical protein
MAKGGLDELKANWELMGRQAAEEAAYQRRLPKGYGCLGLTS